MHYNKLKKYPVGSSYIIIHQVIKQLFCKIYGLTLETNFFETISFDKNLFLVKFRAKENILAQLKE